MASKADNVCMPETQLTAAGHKRGGQNDGLAGSMGGPTGTKGTAPSTQARVESAKWSCNWPRAPRRMEKSRRFDTLVGGCTCTWRTPRAKDQ